MRKIFLLMIIILQSSVLFSLNKLPNISKDKIINSGFAPSPSHIGRDVGENGEVRLLEKNFTTLVEAKVNVFVPLEVITDIDIESTVIGDQIVDIPFDIELNRKPEKENYYSIKYSENLIDIDGDGSYDTYIHSPKYINDKVEKNNFVRVFGENISSDGTYKKDIYITVEVGE